MYRLFLTLFFVFFFSQFVANAQEQQLVFEGVTVDSAQQKIKLSWQIEDSVLVYIFKCNGYCNQETNHIPFDTVPAQPNEWLDIDEDPTHKYYYSIAWSSGDLGSGKIDIQNNIVLKATAGDCKNSVSLSWTPYTKISFEPAYKITNIADTYNIYYRDTVNESALVFYKTINSNNTTQDIMCEVEKLDNKTTYEFVIEAISTNYPIRPLSNSVILTTDSVLNMPVDVTITGVSVVDDTFIEIAIKTDDFPDAENVIGISLLRGIRGNSSVHYDTIVSLPFDSVNIYSYNDKEADPHAGLYYYQAIAEHKCKMNDYSNILTNIFLTGDRVKDEKYEDKLAFSQFGDVLAETYDLWANGKLFQTDVNSTLIVNAENFIKDGSDIKYQIISANGEKSNIKIISHEPVISFPTAFYPSANARDKDQTFYPIIDFASEDDYHFYIYNRWGQELFHATKPPVNGDYFNKETCWDGTFKGQDCPAGIYAYKISYTYNKGKGNKGKYADTGSVMLIR